MSMPTLDPQLGRQVHYVSNRGPMYGVSPAIITMAIHEFIEGPSSDKVEDELDQYRITNPQNVHLTVFGLMSIYYEYHVPHAPDADVPGSWHWFTECSGRLCRRIVERELPDGSVRDPEEVQEQEMFDQVRKNREAVEPVVLTGVAAQGPDGSWVVDPSADPKVFTEPAQWKSYATSYIEGWVAERSAHVRDMRGVNEVEAASSPPNVAYSEAEISDIERLIDVAQEVLTLRYTEGDTSVRASQISS